MPLSQFDRWVIIYRLRQIGSLLNSALCSSVSRASWHHPELHASSLRGMSVRLLVPDVETISRGNLERVGNCEQHARGWPDHATDKERPAREVCRQFLLDLLKHRLISPATHGIPCVCVP